MDIRYLGRGRNVSSQMIHYVTITDADDAILIWQAHDDLINNNSICNNHLFKFLNKPVTRIYVNK